MQLTARQEEDATIVTVQGRVDGVTAPEFESYLSEFISQGRCTFIVNFSALEYISSAGLRSILATAKKLKTEGGTICFTGLKGTVDEVFKISGFYSVFKVFDTNEAALNNI
jgi:anti-sigma B factor antagonist